MRYTIFRWIVAALLFAPPVAFAQHSSSAQEDEYLQQRLEATGRDPEAILAFVANAIALEGYDGAMRGAAGTLGAQAGSSGDKALLLAALLRAADPAAEVRFAYCTLGGDAAERLRAVALLPGNRPQPILEAAGRLAPHMGSPEARRVAEGLALIWSDAVETVRRHAEGIEAGFSDAGFRNPPTPVSDEELLLALSRHLWVQLRRGGDWSDFDPSVPDARPDQSMCVAETTSVEFPEAAVHRLQVQVILKERTDGAVTERTLLDVEVATPDLISGGLSFMFAEPLGIRTPGAGGSPPEGYAPYTPLVRWNGQERFGEPLVLPRPQTAPNDTPSHALGGLAGGLSSGIADAFGALGAEPAPTVADSAPPSNQGVVGVWLRITAVAPDGTRRETTAPIFDLLGFARSAGMDPVPPPSELVEVGGSYRDLSGVWDIAVLDGRWQPLPMSAEQPDGDGIAALLSDLRVMHGGYDLLRESLYEASTGARAPRFYRSFPGVSLLGLIPDSESGAGVSYVMDVVMDQGRHLPGAQGSAAATTARAASVVIAERLTVNFPRLVLPLVGAEDAPGYAPFDLVALFEAAADQGIDIRSLVKSGTEWSGQPPSPDAQARVEARLREGDILLAPGEPVSLGTVPSMGWWILDQRSGLITDEMENGRHQAAAEEAAATQPARQAAPAIRRLGWREFCTVNRVRGLIGIVAALSGDPSGAQVMKDAISLEQKIVEAIDKTRKAGNSVANPPGGCSAG